MDGGRRCAASAMTTNAKHVVLFVALAGTLLAAWFAPSTGDGDMLPAARAPAAAHPDAAPIDAAASRSHPAQRVDSRSIEVLGLHERGTAEADDEPGARLFDPAPWAQSPRGALLQTAAPPAPTPMPAAALAAVAQAPALPFRVLGRYEEGGKAAVFLQHMDRSLVVRVGDTIAEHYEVQALGERTLTLRYLPLDLVQSLALDAGQ
ncbi:hypothetical protein D8B34_06205 [Verminephrobacter eiseniae]|nr:hypothetical protein [Verminephrobacter eiseniae]MCW8183612.1 hypothetical protein [Verminephrobacter eiseniae]MCW8223383.1 hypothetical protein [Verminephrobacter eiseniae]MCW8233395.1 hypothetical protein [Verminephrobacter eiseniae]